MSLNDNKPTYGTAPAVEENLGTKGSRRGLVVGLAAAACFAIGFAAASVGPTQGLRGTALYVKDDNISGGDVKAGGCVGGGCGDSGFTTKPAPPVKPVAGVAGVPGLGGATPPTPPAPPATPTTPTTIGPVVQTGDKPITIGGPTQTDSCCQVFGSCPEGYQSSGTVVPNTACCKDLSKGLSISSDMPMCPTTPATDPFPNPDWTWGDPIGPITPTIGGIKTPHTETNGIFGAGGFDGGMGQGFPFTGGESTGVGAGPAVNAGAGMPGAGGEDVGFGVPHSHKTTPGGGVAAQGY